MVEGPGGSRRRRLEEVGRTCEWSLCGWYFKPGNGMEVRAVRKVKPPKAKA